MIDQIGIALTGVVAVSLTQSEHASRRRYACIFGIIGQPFWFYAAIDAQQWGVTFVCILYTLAWLKGIWLHWIKPMRESRERRIAEVIRAADRGVQAWKDATRARRGTKS